MIFLFIIKHVPYVVWDMFILKKLYIIHLKFKFNWVSYTLSAAGFHFFFKNFIEVSVLISAVQQSELVKYIYTYIYIHTFSYSFPL